MYFEREKLTAAFQEAGLPAPPTVGRHPTLQTVEFYMLRLNAAISSSDVALYIEPLRNATKAMYGEEIPVVGGVGYIGSSLITNKRGDTPVNIMLATEDPQRLVNTAHMLHSTNKLFFFCVTHTGELFVSQNTPGIPSEDIRLNKEIAELLNEAHAHKPETGKLTLFKKMEIKSPTKTT